LVIFIYIIQYILPVEVDLSTQRINVAILDDHQSIIDGYTYRLEAARGVHVVATALFGAELHPMLREHQVDVLLIDLSIQTSAHDPNPYPVLRTLPQLLQEHPDLKVLIISMYSGPGLIRTIMESGVSGYITKDEYEALKNLGDIVLGIANGDIYFSEESYRLYRQYENIKTGDLLTPRQIEALSLCALHPDLSTAELAELLAVSNSTTRNLLSGAYLRLGVHSRIAAVEKARELGLILPYPPTPRDEKNKR
jgi:two-component system nitrate/nitrite response regulator NarL